MALMDRPLMDGINAIHQCRPLIDGINLMDVFMDSINGWH
jgi:hypothetical protein